MKPLTRIKNFKIAKLRSTKGTGDLIHYDSPIYEKTKEYFEYLVNTDDPYCRQAKVCLDRLNKYCEGFKKHLVDFSEDEIIKYLVDDAISTSVIINNANGANKFIIHMNLIDKIDFNQYIEKAKGYWANSNSYIIDFDTLKQMMNEIFENYKFFQLPTILLLAYHGLSFEEIDNLNYSSNIDFDNRLITLNNREIAINDFLMQYLKKCKEQKEFYVPKLKRKNTCYVNSNSDLVISGLATTKHGKKEDNNYRSRDMIYRRLKYLDNNNSREWLKILNMLNYSGMLNDFVFHKQLLVDSIIEEYLLKYNCYSSDLKNVTRLKKIRDFKLIYEKCISRDFNYIEISVNYTKSKEIVDEYPDNEVSENEYFDYEFHVPDVLPQNNKLSIATSKNHGKIEIGNRSEEYVMSKYKNATYVDDRCGYDIHDYDTKTYIEVKTIKMINNHNNFIITINELIAAEKFGDKYILYLVKYKGDTPFDYMIIHDPIKYFNIDIMILRKSLKNNKLKLTPKSFTIEV